MNRTELLSKIDECIAYADGLADYVGGVHFKEHNQWHSDLWDIAIDARNSARALRYRMTDATCDEIIDEFRERMARTTAGYRPNPMIRRTEVGSDD